MTKKYTAIRRAAAMLLIALIALAAPFTVAALDLSTYAGNSVLATGKWVKVSVDRSGVYRISNASMQRMGFSDPSKVKVYGYGGRRLPDRLDNTYIDDLPPVPVVRTAQGLVFYAFGPDNVQSVNSTRLRPVNNPFSTVGYYYLSDRDGEEPVMPEKGDEPKTGGATQFNEAIFHEVDQVNAGETGHMLLGEDFVFTPKRTFNFTLPGKVAGTDVWMECSFMAKSSSLTRLAFHVNGKKLEELPTDAVGITTDDHGHYKEARLAKEFKLDDASLKLTVEMNNKSLVTLANLNYLAINYTRSLDLGSDAQFPFTLTQPVGALAGASSSTLLWDVTDPADVYALRTLLDGTTLCWNNSRGGLRRYVAFNPAANFPEPTYVGPVANQNLHAEEVPDMVIFTIANWTDQAQRLADFHAQSADSLKVLVVNQDDVFNEFSSGARDVNAFRKMLKMLYDRSKESDTKLQYALFFGRGTYDNRQLTSAISRLGYPVMPIWETDSGANDTDSFTTDDIFAFLDDNSGSSFGSENYCIAVGRLPVISNSEAKMAVDKIFEYTNSMPATGWQNRALIIADDDDNGVHMDQAERLYNQVLASNGGADVMWQKLYTDEYPLQGGQYPMAREVMFKALDEGIAWWFFIGHANTTSWTHERLLTYTDINNLYLKRYPIVYAACCDFLRWDAKDVSAAEIMWSLKSGGAIAIISAVRPSYISDNGNLSRQMGRFVFARDAKTGRRPTIGTIVRNVKNGLKSDTNKLRYVLIGDPAMYPAVPHNHVEVTTINGVEVGDPTRDAVLQAREVATIEGRIVDGLGNPLDDFTGIVSSTLYDAEYSVTTHGNGENGRETVFDKQGARIFAGNDSIVNGRFSVNVAMPSAITNNYRPAAVSLYAHPSAGSKYDDAAGVNRSFYVFGEDENAVDDEAPVIHSIYLNHPSFRDGDFVNNSPMLVAEISDNRGINLSPMGIGHQMNILIDDRTSFNDVNEYYTPSSSGVSGTIAYPLQSLSEGEHTLRLRVWDTSDNSAVAVIKFYVSAEKAPVIYDIYSDANPASVQANFYLTHDRPDASIEVTLSVYNLQGRQVWSTTTTGRSDLFRSFPIAWNLTDFAGRRVQRGIYLYRATIKADGTESKTVTKRIAVTG